METFHVPEDYPELRQILTNWCALNERFVDDSIRRQPDWTDCAWWCSERANVGVLAAAAWQCGLVALQEYYDCDGDPRAPMDLWIGTRKCRGGLQVEAKLPRPAPLDHLPPADAIAASLTWAEFQLRQVTANDRDRLSIVFIVPHVGSMEACAGAAKRLDAYRIACQPAIAAPGHEVISAMLVPQWSDVRRPPHLDRRHYPGVLLLGRLSRAS